MCCAVSGVLFTPQTLPCHRPAVSWHDTGMSSTTGYMPSPASRLAEYEFRHVVLPRGTSRGAARRVLTDQAEYGRWELARVRLLPDGTRRVVFRRKIIRVRR